jgi:RNA polymerase sigma-70 factor (ECF subfamily)
LRGREPEAPINSDADLVHRVLHGMSPETGGPGALPGHDSFAVLLRRHEGAVLRLATHLLRNPDDARDVAQDAFLRAYRSLGTFKPELSFKNWLLRIVVNASRDHVSRASARRLRPLDDAGEIAAPGDLHAEVESALLLARVRRCAAELAPREREVFVLRELEGLEVEEIAAVLGLEPPTVRRHLARARLHLRELLGAP